MGRTHQIVELPATPTFKFLWKIDNFSKWNAERFYYSDAFNAGGVTWSVKMYPKGSGALQDYLSVYLVPREPTNLPVDAEYSFAITSKTAPSNTVRAEAKKQFLPAGRGWGFEKFISLSQLHDSKTGYIVNDSFEITVEVSCEAKTKSTDGIIKEKSPGNKVPELELEKQKEASTGETTLELGDYLGAGQPFEGGKSDWEGSELAKELFEDIGGFSVLKKHASLYKKIWLKYGHIPSTKVLPASCYSGLVMLVKDIMNSVMDMNQCRFIDLTHEMIELWEEKIEMAEKLKFNVKWLREQLERMKNGLGGMQKFKAELREQSQTFRATKSAVKAFENLLHIAETQLSEARDELREKVSAILAESDAEMYLDIGENLLFDGIL